MTKERPAPLGSDGKPMTVWQVWLKRLCMVMIAWAGLELAIGVLFFFAGYFVPADVAAGIEGLIDLSAQEGWTLLGISAVVGAFFNVVIAFLGIRGAENPHQIALFFWIALIDAVITTWALVSNISIGIIDPSSIVSGTFIIALAVCAWEVRKQTGYFDRHP